MGTRTPLQTNEWYHCYNRGVDKRIVFETPEDYERFLAHLYLSNGTRNIRISNISDTHLESILLNERLERGDKLVEVGAYALMPNHMHILLHEVRAGGIASFMQKVFTGYTMYFNNKNKRTGSLFAGTFKSKHIHDDAYLKRALPYVLLNPAELFEPSWKSGGGSAPKIKEKLLTYPYASFSDFFGIPRTESKIINTDWSIYYDQPPSTETMLKEAQEYYQEHHLQV